MSPAVNSEHRSPPGWWVASDGRWYPVELHPAFKSGMDRRRFRGAVVDPPPAYNQHLGKDAEWFRSEASQALDKQGERVGLWIGGLWFLPGIWVVQQVASSGWLQALIWFVVFLPIGLVGELLGRTMLRPRWLRPSA